MSWAAAAMPRMITDGYKACQRLASQLSGIQQCARHPPRRAVTRLGPGSLQSWAGR
jgi:hypothetical protein